MGKLTFMHRIRKLVGIILLLLGLALFSYTAVIFTQQQISVLGAHIVDTPPTLDVWEEWTAVGSSPVLDTATPLPTYTRTIQPSASPTQLEKRATQTPRPLRTSTPTRVISTATRTLTPSPSPIPAWYGALVGSLPRAARILIPTLNVGAPTLEMGWEETLLDGKLVTDWDVPLNEVGWSFNSANPGERGNVVMAGHNNLGTAVFKKLYILKEGDEITVTNATGASFLYRVALSYIVAERDVPIAKRLENAKVMQPTNDARLTLISCWPEWSNSHRAIVIARLVGEIPPARNVPSRLATREISQ